MILGTNSGVALQCSGISETSSQDLLQLTNAIRIKEKYFYISLICAHAPTEDKDDTTKDAFYDKLEVLCNRCPRSDIQILFGEFNAKVGRRYFWPTIAKQRGLEPQCGGRLSSLIC